MKKSLVVLFCVLVLTLGLSAGEKQKPFDIGAFPLCLKIGTGKIGAVSFTANFLVNPFQDKMTGYGKIFQPVSPPLNIDLQLNGHYSCISFLDQTLYIVHFTGYQELHSTTGILKIIKARGNILFWDGWNSGVCSYKYMDDNGNWVKVDSVPVKTFDCFPPHSIHSQGENLEVPGTYWCDLDNGKIIGPNKGQSPTRSDFLWEQVDRTIRYIVPEKVVGAKLRVLGKVNFEGVSYDYLKTLTYSFDKINGSNNKQNQIPKGTVLACRTSEGRYCKFRIDKYGYNLKISWVTYAK